MKVSIDKIENLIRLPEDFAILVSIDRRGYYRYKFKYDVHVINVIEAQARVVNIQLSENTPNLQQATLFTKGNSPADIIKSIRLQSSIQSELRRAASAKIFFSHRSDFTRLIDFGLVSGRREPDKKIRKRGNASIEEMVAVDGLATNILRYNKRRKRWIVRAASDVSKEGNIIPVVLQNRAASLDMNSQGGKRLHKTLSYVLTPRENQEFFNSVLIKVGLEPADYLAEATNNIISAQSSMAGTISQKTPKKSRQILKGKPSERRGGLSEGNKGFRRSYSKKILTQVKTKNRRRALPAQYARKLASILANKRLTNTTNPAASNELDANGLFAEEITEFVEFETVEEIVDIPMGLLSAESFRATFSVRGRGRELKKISKQVPHATLLANAELPRSAPYFETASISKPGLALFQIEQTDENGTGVAIYKKIVPLDEPQTTGKFTLVNKIPLIPEAGKVFFSDAVSTTKPVIYRAMTYNRNGAVSGVFTSAVVNNNSKEAKKRSKNTRKSSFCSLTHTISQKTIELEIRNVSPGPTSLTIQRRDLTAHEQAFTNVAANIMVPDSSKVIRRTDELVKEERIYEYRILLTYKNGDTEVANNNLIVEFVEPDSSIVSILVSQPKISETSKGIDATMTITKDIANTDMDVIKGFLKEQGLDEQYADEVYTARKELQNLFFTRVVRQNLITGAEEEFGPLTSNTFSDYAVGRTRNVKPLEAGGLYRYAFYTYARDPQTMFDELVRIIKKTSTSVQLKTGETYNPNEYSFSPAKWHHPVTLKEGNLVSDKSLARNHAKNAFTFGKLVDIDYIDLNLIGTTPSVENVLAVSLDEYSNLISWDASGDVTKFDHFIISVEISGIKDIVGKCHNIDANGRFTYVDTLNNDEEGPLVYTVTPVYFDMNFGTEESAEVLII